MSRQHRRQPLFTSWLPALGPPSPAPSAPSQTTYFDGPPASTQTPASLPEPENEASVLGGQNEGPAWDEEESGAGPSTIGDLRRTLVPFPFAPSARRDSASSTASGVPSAIHSDLVFAPDVAIPSPQAVAHPAGRAWCVEEDDSDNTPPSLSTSPASLAPSSLREPASPLVAPVGRGVFYPGGAKDASGLVGEEESDRQHVLVGTGADAINRCNVNNSQETGGGDRTHHAANVKVRPMHRDDLERVRNLHASALHGEEEDGMDAEIIKRSDEYATSTGFLLRLLTDPSHLCLVAEVEHNEPCSSSSTRSSSPADGTQEAAAGTKGDDEEPLWAPPRSPFSISFYYRHAVLASSSTPTSASSSPLSTSPVLSRRPSSRLSPPKRNVVGCVSARLFESRSPASSGLRSPRLVDEDEFHELHVLTLAVSGTARRKGVARRLLEELFQRVLNSSSNGFRCGRGDVGLRTALPDAPRLRATLHVHALNLPALSLYSSLGFVRARAEGEGVGDGEESDGKVEGYYRGVRDGGMGMAAGGPDGLRTSDAVALARWL